MNSEKKLTEIGQKIEIFPEEISKIKIKKEGRLHLVLLPLSVLLSISLYFFASFLGYRVDYDLEPSPFYPFRTFLGLFVISDHKKSKKVYCWFILAFFLIL